MMHRLPLLACLVPISLDNGREIARDIMRVQGGTHRQHSKRVPKQDCVQMPSGLQGGPFRWRSLGKDQRKPAEMQAISKNASGIEIWHPLNKGCQSKNARVTKEFQENKGMVFFEQVFDMPNETHFYLSKNAKPG
jgi:hypothetical protein